MSWTGRRTDSTATGLPARRWPGRRCGGPVLLWL